MTNLLNKQRPPAFCPGCLHERVVHVLDTALHSLHLQGHQVAIVTDIGCSGLFDTFFNTHALHGLHGRALTYATGLKLSCPALTVIVIMGDGGLGIGGAHVLSSCRRNLDINLLVLNNFNYGMTGGQCSATTPQDAATSSTFLNNLEAPLDICSVARAAGAPYLSRIMATDSHLGSRLQEAISYPGFTITDIWGVCPGRFGKRNRKTLKQMEEELTTLPPAAGPEPGNERQEYGTHYRHKASQLPQGKPITTITATMAPQITGQRRILILGAAGMRINTAGELLCLGALHSGLHVTQKNDYPITVLRGHSISEVILSRTAIRYTGITRPDVILALAPDGIARRRRAFQEMEDNGLIIKLKGLELPPTKARIIELDHRHLSLATNSLGLASLALLVKHSVILSEEMLKAALVQRFREEQIKEAAAVIDRCLEVR